MTPDERAAWLAGLRLVVDAAEAAFTHVLADFDAAGDGERLHAAPSTQSWLRGVLGLASGEASERVRVARASRTTLAAPVAALVAGSSASDSSASDSDLESSGDESTGGPATHLSYEHVRAVHRTLRALPPSVHQDAVETLTVLAGHLGVDDLRAAGRHLRSVVDPDGSARHAESDFGRRWLSISPLLDGMSSIDGVLDAESATRLTMALAPYLVPSDPDDLRTADQRRADGLVEIVETAVRSGDLPTLSGASTALQVEVPFATLVGDSPRPARVVGNTASAVWLLPASAERLSCDASVRRLLFDPTGVPLDLGRQVRAFTSAQRKALAARDAGCRFPGCGRPAQHTDAHHIVPWARGGVSDLTNGLLLCRHHHRRVHEGGWTITTDDPSRGANGPCTFRGPQGQVLRSAPGRELGGPAP
jgi:hypothetical protein